MNIIYREAEINDNQEIARLSNQLGYPVEADQVIQRLQGILSHKDNVVIVAEIKEKLVGWVHAHGRYLIESYPFIEIGGLVVDDEFRKQSIGKNLMRCVEDWGRSMEFKEIRLRSGGTRIEAHQFYIRLGYDNIKMQQVFRREL
jgi:GNAT superfamily N-acetyltransferase